MLTIAMTTKNAILMIVKQNSGIDYNSLLNKFASSYSSINSARAALSRSLKDLITFGLVEKKGGRVYILQKGESEIYSAVKNKLVLSLNSAMKQKRPENEIEPVVEKLQILIERSRQDRDLLKTSKSSLDFTVSDLERAKEGLEKKVKHLDYLSRVFSEQISSLREMDFYDSHERPVDSQSIKGLSDVFSSLPDSEFTVDCRGQQVLQIIAEHFGLKPKETRLSVPKGIMSEFLTFIGNNRKAFAEPAIIIFSSVLKAEFMHETVRLYGPYSEIQKWRQ